MVCHGRRRPPCVLLKGHAAMPPPTSYDHVCCQRAILTYETPDVVRPFILSKGDDGMPSLDIMLPFMLSKGDDGMLPPT